MTDSVTREIEYKGKKITFDLKKFDDKPPMTLWYVEVWVEGFKKPFQSKMIASIFARDRYERAKNEPATEEYLKKLFSDVEIIMSTKAEILTVDLDTLLIMWYCDGKVEIEEDKSLLSDIKKLIDHLDQDISQLVLKNSGFL